MDKNKSIIPAKIYNKVLNGLENFLNIISFICLMTTCFLAAQRVIHPPGVFIPEHPLQVINRKKSRRLPPGEAESGGIWVRLRSQLLIA